MTRHRLISALTVLGLCVGLCRSLAAQDKTLITIQPAKVRQEFDGLGVGAIFYEGHITSLAARQKAERQEQLYDDMFAKLPTRYLQLMIRETHEPANDNDDPNTPAFDEKNFEYCKHTIAIAKAALKRQPDMQFYATLYTPPPWMKTNGAPGGGGEAKATLKPGLELELAEYVWTFLAHLQKNGIKVEYLSIANEPDWPHEQPGYFLTPEKNAALVKIAGEYLDKMAKKYPDVPRPKFVGPNTLSAPGAAKTYVPALIKTAPKYLEVIGSHDYDPRGDRWAALKKLGGKRPVWVTEWCARKKDMSSGMINSATEYGVAMHEAFAGGANVFMAYDWAYPPRDSGEAFIHVDWGNDYKLTKPYHLFRQWAEPVKPGMKFVDAISGGKSAEGIRPTALVTADGKSLVVHVVNAQDKDAAVSLKITGKVAAAERKRTSGMEDVVPLPPLTGTLGTFNDTLPARSMTTYRFEVK